MTKIHVKNPGRVCQTCGQEKPAGYFWAIIMHRWRECRKCAMTARCPTPETCRWATRENVGNALDGYADAWVCRWDQQGVRLPSWVRIRPRVVRECAGCEAWENGCA